MGKKKTSKRIADSQLDSGDGESAQHDVASIEDGKVVDYITGNQVKDAPKEKVRQRIARAIWHEYGFSPNDMQPDFKVNVGGRRKGVDMAVVEKVGYDRRGNTLYKRSPDGEEILVDVQKPEKVRVGGEFVTRQLTRKEPVLDDDMPVIAEEYRKFRQKHPVPGS